MARPNFAHTVLHRRLPVAQRIPRQCVDHLGRLVVERNGVPQAAARDEVQSRRENRLHLHLSWIEQIHLIFQARRLWRGRAGGRYREHRHRRKRPPIIVDLVPVDRTGVYLPREISGFDGNVAVSFHEALQRTLRRRLWIGRLHAGGEVSARAGDGHPAVVGTARSLAPIQAHPQALLFLHRALGRAQHDPRRAGGSREFEGRLATIEYAYVALRLVQQRAAEPSMAPPIAAATGSSSSWTTGMVLTGGCCQEV